MHKINEENPQHSEKKMFQHKKVRLGCFGECGSKIMTHLIETTNLETFKKYEIKREFDLVFGTGPKPFYQQLSFRSEQQFMKFTYLVAAHMINHAHQTMG